MAWLTALTGGSAQPPETWRLLVEPKFMKAPVSEPMTGAKKAELAAAFVAEGGLEILTRAQFVALGVSWETFTAQAQANAETDLPALAIAYTRNPKKIIEYATVRSERGLIASAVRASGFLALFKDTLGDKVLVAIPNRTTAFVFPGLASRYQDFAPLILAAYRSTSFPVSTEVFECSREGMRAIGVYEEP